MPMNWDCWRYFLQTRSYYDVIRVIYTIVRTVRKHVHVVESVYSAKSYRNHHRLDNITENVLPTFLSLWTFYLRFQECTMGYIWSLYVHYVYLLIYYLSVIRSFNFFNIKYEYNITWSLPSFWTLFKDTNSIYRGSELKWNAKINFEETQNKDR